MIAGEENGRARLRHGRYVRSIFGRTEVLNSDGLRTVGRPQGAFGPLPRKRKADSPSKRHDLRAEGIYRPGRGSAVKCQWPRSSRRTITAPQLTTTVPSKEENPVSVDQ